MFEGTADSPYVMPQFSEEVTISSLVPFTVKVLGITQHEHQSQNVWNGGCDEDVLVGVAKEHETSRKQGGAAGTNQGPGTCETIVFRLLMRQAVSIQVIEDDGFVGPCAKSFAKAEQYESGYE